VQVDEGAGPPGARHTPVFEHRDEVAGRGTQTGRPASIEQFVLTGGAQRRLRGAQNTRR
jgi:hypothetical protein